MGKRRICENGPLVSKVGLGCMGRSDFYGEQIVVHEKDHSSRNNLTPLISF